MSDTTHYFLALNAKSLFDWFQRMVQFCQLKLVYDYANYLTTQIFNSFACHAKN